MKWGKILGIAIISLVLFFGGYYLGTKSVEPIVEERSKDVEVAHGTLSTEAYDHLLKAKDWTVEAWEAIGFLF